MATQVPHEATWSDEQLPAAIAASTSWRGVMRKLGLNPANGGTTRIIRRRAALLGLDSSHFRSNRSWSDAVLRQAVVPYDPEVIELFFIVDGDLAIYLIPSRVIAGRVQLLLRTYSNFIVGNVAGLMASRPCAA